MTAFTDWVPFVQGELPNCPRALMIDAIRQSVIDFCQRTQFWRYRMDSMTTQANVAQYELDTPANCTMVSVRALSFDGRSLTERNIDDLDNDSPQWRARAGRPDHYVFLDPNTIILSAIPADSGLVMDATVTLKPTQDSAWCDDSLFAEYRDAIAAGAMARLMLTAGKPWSDPQLAQLKQQSFITSTESASDRALRGLGRRVRPRIKANYF